MKIRRPTRARDIIIAAGCIAVLAAAGTAAWRHWWPIPGITATAQAGASRNASAGSAAAKAVPVTAGTAALENVPVYLTGLGTVQAYNTVTVKVRVDGQIDKVAFTEGQTVKRGDVLAQIDARPYQAQLDQAVAKKSLDEATLANAKLDLDRYTTLAKTSSAPVQQVDTQRALVAQLEAQVTLDQGSIDSAKTYLDYCKITSPINGRTGVRLVDEGNIVHASDTTGLVVITQLQPITVLFTLPQDQLQAVMAEMASASSPLKVLAVGRDNQQQLGEGTLALVDNVIDPSTGSVRLKATFPNDTNALWPGQFVNVRLLLKTLQQVVTVPSPAIQRGPDGMYVYVIKPDSTVTPQPVQVVQMADQTSVIGNGLQAGSKIVVQGQYRLQRGSLIAAAEALGAAVSAADDETAAATLGARAAQP